MTSTQSSQALVPVEDKQTRRRAAVAVGKAYRFSLVGWVNLVLFGAISLWFATIAADCYRDFGWSLLTIGATALAVLSACWALFYVQLANAWVIYRAEGLYYLDNGQARAALALKPDEDRRWRRRTRVAGDEHAHTFGAWPKGEGAGGALGAQVRDLVHARGGRVTGTAMPGLAKIYKEHDMVEVGRVAWFLIRIASVPDLDASSTAQPETDNTSTHDTGDLP